MFGIVYHNFLRQYVKNYLHLMLALILSGTEQSTIAEREKSGV